MHMHLGQEREKSLTEIELISVGTTKNLGRILRQIVN